MMNFKLQSVYPILIVILLTACGNPPLTAPERTESIAQSEQVVQAEPTATLAIVGGSADSPLASPTASVEPTESPTLSPTSPGSRPSETPRPTGTPDPPTQTPRPTRTPPPLATMTIAPPGHTTTPQPATPVPTTEVSPFIVKVISDEPFFPSELLSKMGIREDNFTWVEAWPSTDEIILRVGYHPNSKFWMVSKQKGEARQISNWQPEKASQAVVNELQKYNETVDYAVVSPDGQWAAWASWETLLVKRLSTKEPPVNLLGKKYERFEGGVNELVWSPDSKQIAYAVDNGNAGRYEIRISDPLGQKTLMIPLWDTRPHYITWSPDNVYLAFTIQEQPQSENRNIYLIRKEGEVVTQLTKNDRAESPIHWSPTGMAILYRKDAIGAIGPWLITFEIQ